MELTSKASDKRKKAFGISLTQEEVDRLDALADRAYATGGNGKRSMFIVETLFIGLERRYGPNWRELADEIRTVKKEPVAA